MRVFDDQLRLANASPSVCCYDGDIVRRAKTSKHLTSTPDPGSTDWGDGSAGPRYAESGVAQAAETRRPGAFAGDSEPVRLVMRRVNPKAAKPGEDRQLLRAWRYHAFVINRWVGTTVEADRWHRAHAQVEKRHQGSEVPRQTRRPDAADRRGHRLLVVEQDTASQAVRMARSDSPTRPPGGRPRAIRPPWANAVAVMLTRLWAIPAPT